MIQLNKKIKPISKDYFENYGGDNYSKSYKYFTVPPYAVIENLNQVGIKPETLLDVGCASGELVRDFRNLGISAFGIENNPEILKKCICPEYCIQMDCRDMSSIKKEAFDIVYTNSLMYLLPQEIGGVLKEFHRICKLGVYFCNPYLETCDFDDPCRTFLATRTWWESQFAEAGFEQLDYDIFVKCL